MRAVSLFITLVLLTITNQIDFLAKKMSAAIQATAPRQSTQHSNWCFTYNYGRVGQVSREDVEAFLDVLREKANYFVAGWETAPETGQLHLQGYVQLEVKQRLTALKRLGPTVHWEVAMGDEESNFDYCTKGGDFIEHGEPRVVHSGRREKKRWAVALETVKKCKDWSEAEELDPQIQIQFARQLDYLADRLRPAPKDLEPGTRHMWLWGPSGSGKSRKAREIFKERFPDVAFYNKLQNKWWDHYNGNDRPVLIDDLEYENGRALVAYLKLWLDFYVFKVEYKGGAKDIRPPFLIITSNFHPWDIFGDKPEQWFEPIMRRLDVVYVAKEGEAAPPKGPADMVFPEPVQVHPVIDNPGLEATMPLPEQEVEEEEVIYVGTQSI